MSATPALARPPAGSSEPGGCSTTSFGRQMWARLVTRRAFWLALLVLVGFVCLALLAPWLTPPQGPAQAGGQSKGAFVASADDAWKGVAGRAIYAARVSVLFNLCAAGSALLLGAALGISAGWLGGRADTVLARLLELVEAFPDLLLLVTIMAAWRTTAVGKSAGGLVYLFLALTLVYSVNAARLARAWTLEIKESAFVLAAHNLGLSDGRIFRRHVLPVTLARLLPAAAFQIQAVVIAETALGYLGLGLKPGASTLNYFFTSWGVMLFEGQLVVTEQPLALLVPATCLALLLLALAALGVGLQKSIQGDSTTRTP